MQCPNSMANTLVDTSPEHCHFFGGFVLVHACGDLFGESIHIVYCVITRICSRTWSDGFADALHELTWWFVGKFILRIGVRVLFVRFGFVLEFTLRYGVSICWKNWHVVVIHSGKQVAAVELFYRSSKFAHVIATEGLGFSRTVAWPLQVYCDCDRDHF